MKYCAFFPPEEWDNWINFFFQLPKVFLQKVDNTYIYLETSTLTHTQNIYDVLWLNQLHLSSITAKHGPDPIALQFSVTFMQYRNIKITYNCIYHITGESFLSGLWTLFSSLLETTILSCFTMFLSHHKNCCLYSHKPFSRTIKIKMCTKNKGRKFILNNTHQSGETLLPFCYLHP